MFQINEFTEARLATLTPRSEKHGEDDVPAVSLGLEFTVANTLLDVIDPKIRHSLYMAVEGQDDLPGVEPATRVLRCNSFDRHTLPAKYEGWTMHINDGIDDTKPMTFGACKVDKLNVEAKQGGTVILRLRVGTSDLDAERAGFLGMHVGQSVWIMLNAPEKQPDVIDASKDAKDLPPDAGSLFGAQHGNGGGPEDGDDDGPDDEGDGDSEGGDPDADGPWPFPRPGSDVEAPPQSVTVEQTDPSIAGGAQSFEKAVKAELEGRASTRTARGRDATKAALAKGATH